MIDSTSTGEPRRPRVRRGLGVLVGVAIMATPFAIAPAASAQEGAGPDLIQQIVGLLQQILGGLGHTLQTPLGEQAPNAEARGCHPDGIGSLASCVIAPIQDPIDPGKRAKAKVKASTRKGKVTSVRRVR